MDEKYESREGEWKEEVRVVAYTNASNSAKKTYAK